MSKRKFDMEPMPPSITEAQIRAFSEFIACMPSDLSGSAILERMQETSQQAYSQATKFKNLIEVADLLDVSFRHDDTHSFRLRDSELRNTKALDEPIASILQRLKTSEYFQDRMLEGHTRTKLELIFLDRLEKLQDQHASYRLRFSPEISVYTEAASEFGRLKIRGFADWTLNYKTNTPSPRSESTLIITEAKRIGDAPAGLPQLLIYMVGIHQQRQKQERINRGVFGILADSVNYIFAFLDHQRNFYITDIKNWGYRSLEILAYIDTILLDTIESSPHTTLTKKGNAVLHNYQKYLGQRWLFGEKAFEKETVAEEAVGEEIIAGEATGKVVDVNEKGMVVVIRERPQQADEEPSSEIAEAE